eukprot:6214840-Pleurochrysis_carterae.AAC.2
MAWDTGYFIKRIRDMLDIPAGRFSVRAAAADDETVFIWRAFKRVARAAVLAPRCRGCLLAGLPICAELEP